MKQSKLSFTRVLRSVEPNLVRPSLPPASLKRSRSPEAEPKLEPESSVRPAKQSRTAMELGGVDRQQAYATVARLRSGYRDKSGAGYPAALSNEAGCILVQKAPNRDENGYVQIAPVVSCRTRVRKGDLPRRKPAPQNAHRLVILAYKTDEEIDRLLAGDQASHLCHQPTCINPDHLVVETKAANERRKACRALGPIIKTVWAGRELTLPPRGECTCPGKKCIFMIERREAVASE